MFVDWTPEHVVINIAAYRAISADSSPWTDVEFLSDLPGKWELSFGAWLTQPVAYCVMSRKFGAPHIHQFMVHPELRGRGVGEKMLAEAVKRGAVTLKVDAKNEGAIRFYKRHGWQAGKNVGQYLWMNYQSA